MSALLAGSQVTSTFIQPQRISSREANNEPPLSKPARSDSASFGVGGPPSTAESIRIANERMISKIKSLLATVRSDLGLPEGADLDTSPEATANRIFDFATAFFDAFKAQHKDLDEDEARQQFAQIIGGGMAQGIQEARQILGALGGLNEDVDKHITATASILEKKLQDFVDNSPTRSVLRA